MLYLMIITLPNPHAPNLRPRLLPIRSILLRLPMNQRPRPIPHRLIRVPLPLDV